MEEVEAVEAPEGALKDRYDLLLRAPFPPIEIIRWWPKLREEDGETLLDENGKTILGEPCWFTFDNRRLYCLQAAAIKNWPCRAAAVVHVMHDLPVSKCAPKKFRTTDLGCSVRISRRDDVVPKATWTWMEAAGQIDRESADYRRSMEGIMLDENKEHWSELLDVPVDFMGGGGGEDYQLYRPKWDEDREESTVNTRTARRILKAGGCRVSRAGTEAQAAAATVAAAAAAAKASSSLARKGSKDAAKPAEETMKETEAEASDPWALGKTMQASATEWDGMGSGYYEESEMYGQDLNSMYLAAYNGAQASMAWQFQQQMMGGMLMQMQQMQMQQRLQQAKAQRAREAREAALKQKAEKEAREAKAKAVKEAERAERERVRVAEAVMRLKNQQIGSMGSVGSMGGSRANELPKQFGSLGSLGGSNELPSIGSILLKELNGFNSGPGGAPSAPSAPSGSPSLSSALGTLGALGSVGSVLSSASNAKPSAPSAPSTSKGGDASSQSTKLGNSPSSPVSSSSLSQGPVGPVGPQSGPQSGLGGVEKPPGLGPVPSGPRDDDDDDVNCNQQ